MRSCWKLRYSPWKCRSTVTMVQHYSVVVPMGGEVVRTTVLGRRSFEIYHKIDWGAERYSKSKGVITSLVQSLIPSCRWLFLWLQKIFAMGGYCYLTATSDSFGIFTMIHIQPVDFCLKWLRTRPRKFLDRLGFIFNKEDEFLTQQQPFCALCCVL